MTCEIEFRDFTEDEKASLPEQIEVLPDSAQRLRLLLRATPDPAGDEVALERVFIKPGLAIAATAAHLECVGWTLLPAGRSPDRELGAGRRSAIGGLLGSVDLGASLSEIVSAVENLHGVVHDAPALVKLRESLASALGELLPRGVEADDLVLELPRADAHAPLADVDVKLKHGTAPRPLRDQSDGVRAMSTVAIQLLARGGARIIAVDEPEIHLHPRAQARTGSMLRDKAGQAVIATHAPAVLTQFSPMHAVAFVGGACRQLSVEPFHDEPKAADQWWTTPTLEPLTSRCVVLVEGVADRVMVEACAIALGFDFDRLGIVVAAVNGAGGFKMALRLFGAQGFGVPLVGLVDLSEADDVAKYLGINRSEVPGAGFLICDPDLEMECVRGLGAEAHARRLIATGFFKESAICAGNSVAGLASLQNEPYAAWCRTRKTEVAAALASELTKSDASSLEVLAAVVADAVARV
nr:AAA family ATPase [Rhabdothermincola salaria]